MNAISVAALLFEGGEGKLWRRADCLVRWPNEIKALESGRLVRVVGAAVDVPCVACGDLHAVEDGDHLVMNCPIAGVVELNAADLAQIVLHQAAWLSSIGAALQLAPPEPVVSNTLWRFERSQTAGWRNQIWVARGIGAADKFDLVARALRASGRRAKWLLTSSDLPQEVGGALRARVIRFAECGDISPKGRLTLDLEGNVGPRKPAKGQPGRKAKVGPAVELFRSRLAGHAASPILAEEARQIAAELAFRIERSAQPSPRTIEDAIRDEHAAAFGGDGP